MLMAKHHIPSQEIDPSHRLLDLYLEWNARHPEFPGSEVEAEDYNYVGKHRPDNSDHWASMRATHGLELTYDRGKYGWNATSKGELLDYLDDE